jgi:hypothetical protein
MAVLAQSTRQDFLCGDRFAGISSGNAELGLHKVEELESDE